MRLISTLLLITAAGLLVAGCASPEVDTEGYSPTRNRAGFLYFYTDG